MMPATLFDSETGDGEELLPHDGSARLYRSAVSPAVAARQFDDLRAEVPWEQRTLRVYGHEVAQPRLVAWFGDAGHSYTYSGMTMDPLPWSPTIQALKSTCETLANETFNSGLANLYRDGNDGVAWHADDEPELGPLPIIASLSLGAERRFDLRHKVTRETIKIAVPSGSLIVMSGSCQTNWLHQVPKQLRVRDARINLTFRNVHFS